MATLPPGVPATPLVMGQPSNDLVHFIVEVDRSRCLPVDPAIDARLQLLENNGLTASIAELVALSAIHFTAAVLDAGEGHEIARVRLAWHLLMDWQLTATPNHYNPNRTVMTVANQPNSRLLALRTETLAVGIGLLIGIRMYDIQYPYWAATPGLQPYDLYTYDGLGGLIALETRGRINRSNVASAIHQIYGKFVQPSFSHAAGVIFFPRTGNRSQTADIMIIDPEGEVAYRGPNQRYRSLLRHYSVFFIAQGGLVRPFGEQLRKISTSPEDVFDDYLRGGLSAIVDRPHHRSRSGFTFKGIRYIGAFWDAVVWPYWLTGIRSPSDRGVFFWGLAKEIVDALETGQVQRLEFPKQETIVERSDKRMAVFLSDFTVFIWAPSQEELDLAEDSAAR